MDLVAATKSGEEMGILDPLRADFAWGASENDFSIEVPNRDYLPAGTILSVPGTEIGGMVTGVDDTSSLSTLKLLGKTWHGILEQSVICPPPGSDYRTVTGDANAVIGSLVSAVGMASWFRREPQTSGIAVSGYKMVDALHDDDDAGRYVPAYSGIVRMLADHGARLRLSYDPDARCVLAGAVAAYDWSKDDEWDSDYCSVGIRRDAFVNHLIILGKGEGAARARADMYIDERGRIVDAAALTGADMWTEVYDFQNAKDEAQARENGKKRLKDGFRKATKVSVDFKAEEDGFCVGDIVGAVDTRTGITANATINKKIARFSRGKGWTVSYETGEF